MKLTDEQLADFVRTSFALRTEAQGEQRARECQRKLRTQAKEINRLLAENARLKELAHSRGQLLIDIQKRAMDKQVNG